MNLYVSSAGKIHRGVGGLVAAFRGAQAGRKQKQERTVTIQKSISSRCGKITGLFILEAGS